MRFRFARVRALLFDVPRTAKLAYCLLRDERVPTGPKLAVGAALGLIVSPLDLPGWIPVIGDLDILALGVLAVRVFVESCSEELVEEHRRLLSEGQSVFDRDLGFALALVTDGVRRLLWRSGLRPTAGGGETRPEDRAGWKLTEESQELEEESA